jgi:hypothetical protein
MALIFNDIFTSCAIRSVESKHQGLVDQRPVTRIDQPAERGVPAIRQATAE